MIFHLKFHRTQPQCLQIKFMNLDFLINLTCSINDIRTRALPHNSLCLRNLLRLNFNRNCDCRVSGIISACFGCQTIFGWTLTAEFMVFDAFLVQIYCPIWNRGWRPTSCTMKSNIEVHSGFRPAPLRNLWVFKFIALFKREIVGSACIALKTRFRLAAFTH